MEKGFIIAKHTSSDLNLAAEDYTIYNDQDGKRVEIVTTILGASGFRQKIDLTFDKEWSIEKAVANQETTQEKVIIEVSEGEATFVKYDKDGNEYNSSVKIKKDHSPVVIFAGSLLMPFLWLKKFVLNDDAKFPLQIIPTGNLNFMIEGNGLINAEYEIGNTMVDYSISFDKITGMIKRCQSYNQNLTIEHV